MSEPTPRPAEQALRDYAAQRRAQTPPTELHPATRRLLQGEVARTYGGNPAPTTPPAAVPWLATWWGRLALGTPALAALVAVFYVLHREREMHLAMTSDPVPPAWRETIEPPTALAPALAAPASAPVMSGEVRTEFKAAADENPALANAAKTEPSSNRDEMRRRQLVAPAGAAGPAGTSPVVDAIPPALNVPPDREAQLPTVASRAEPETRAAASARPDAMPAARALSTPATPATPATPPPTAPGEAPTPSASLYAGLTRKAAGPEAEQLPPPAEPPATPAMTPPPTTTAAPQSAANGARPAATDTAKPALTGLADQRQQFVSQDGRGTLRRNFNSPASARVLESFHFASSGSLVQLTDADGSVYTGRILGRVESNGSPPQPARRLTVLFRVEGTSRSLQQTVEFDGQLVLPATAEPRLKRDGVMTSEPLPGSLQQGQIHGRVVIGGRTRLEVRAVAAP
jgi:hypothetical protein